MNELPEELKELESILIRIRPAKPDEVLMQTYLKCIKLVLIPIDYS